MASGHAPELDQDTARLVSNLECDMVIQTGVLKQYGKINDAVKDFITQKMKISQEKQEVERLREEITNTNKELILEMEQLRCDNQELIRENNELNLELQNLKETVAERDSVGGKVHYISSHGVQTRSMHNKKLQAHNGGASAASEPKEDTFDQVISSRIIAEDFERKRELNEIRKILIQVFADIEHFRQIIRIKMMGQIDIKPFLDAAHREYNSDIAKVEAAKNCSAWQTRIQNPLWHPYRKISEDGPREEVLNDDDETLKELKACGKAIYDAVTEALKEMNEYNMSGRSVVPELWNYREGRKATVVECIQFLGKKAREQHSKKRKTNPSTL
ncbi:hypothetical protein PR202_gb27402 [Eleusine coracana subsp. coracana]|uniref:Factor of DNA methylation 1-5/IDN2 domain-containing protein n=1 Tax=Eleusine coracana subsp. coracana TaxID=191504 RepID=A0AAV5FTS4_ELECO|nr:hypothetical protein QOZ80_4BG0359400 [Eleusine coracana subsp. coracana]GJN38366.1 hypothetical protein PR202_gb27402 [Eleusine coracana subsp. coracana]